MRCDSADLTVYAELHNATDHAVKGIVSGTAAGVRFEQPVELAAHEDRTSSSRRSSFRNCTSTIPGPGGRARWASRTWSG